MKWESDWNGYEVGYDDVLVVGLYMLDDETYAYIDVENNIILEKWKLEDLEEINE